MLWFIHAELSSESIAPVGPKGLGMLVSTSGALKRP